MCTTRENVYTPAAAEFIAGTGGFRGLSALRHLGGVGRDSSAIG